MLTLEELVAQIQSYKDSGISASEFEDWFHGVSWGAYDRPGNQLSDAIANVEFALTEFELGDIDESSLAQELERAIAPFVRVPVYGPVYEIAYGEPSQQGISTNQNRTLRAELALA